MGIGDEQVTFKSPRYEEEIVTPAMMGWSCVAGSVRLAHVVRLAVDAKGVALRQAPSSLAADLLMEHAFYKDRAGSAFSLAVNTARQCGSWRLDAADPTSAAEVLADLLADGS